MDYDLAIIGAGWAGFNAALKAKESGLKVALIENGQIGGTCLNSGCIPTKTLLQSAKVFSRAGKSRAFGIETSAATINFSDIQARKDKIIAQLRRGMEFMLKGIDVISGSARILSANRVSADNKELNVKYILIASGSKPAELKEIKFDGKKVLSSDDILCLKGIPGSLLIIGAGAIGCEFAALFSALGCSVSLIEKMPQVLPGMDKELANKLESIFKKKGIKVSTGAQAQSSDFNNYELVLLSIGRTAKTENLGLEKLGLATEEGKIKVDDFLMTSIPNIYAAGDCAAKVCLAHFAAYQGVIAAHNIANPGNLRKCDNRSIPNCIFTQPEVSSVGLSEEQALNAGFAPKVNKFDFLGLGMARVLDETEGFIKIVSDEKSGVILGGCIIGAAATELIGILTLAVTNSLKVSQLRETIFAHPTLSECIHEALK